MTRRSTLAALTLLLAACGAQSNGSENGGRTHWLRACTEDTQCGGGVCWLERCGVECRSQSECDFASGAMCSEGVCIPTDEGRPVAADDSAEPSGDPTSADPTSADPTSADPTSADPTALEPAPTDLEPRDWPPAAGIWLKASLDAAPAEPLSFTEEVGAYTRDPNNRSLISLTATSAGWGSITLSLVSKPGPVSTGSYACESGATLISATLLTDTGILSLTSDGPAGECLVTLLEPGEQQGAPVSGTFDATLTSTSGRTLTLTEGEFRGVLNE